MISANAAFSSEFSGKDLYAACIAGDKLSNVACRKYISGVAQGMRIGLAIAGKNGDCLPDSATETQLTQIVLKYMQERPQHLHHPAAAIVAIGLKPIFRCPNQ
ncbi:Rap1a/Tai family immunity protein [Rhodopseudomonas palustris]|uniref:Rap1a/Tai family immunity protein n=1 Tax=Rhodopseudomonas palustris TaxID=1076 RepID=UPI0039B6FC01